MLLSNCVPPLRLMFPYVMYPIVLTSDVSMALHTPPGGSTGCLSGVLATPLMPDVPLRQFCFTSDIPTPIQDPQAIVYYVS